MPNNEAAAQLLALAADLCPGDGKLCFVGRGTDDAHFRCGTGQCPHQAALRARATEADQ